MRFHVVSLPHTNTVAEFSTCAYTAKVIGFCKMMMARGHEVFLYAGEQNEAPCTEHIPCISEIVRAAAVGDKHYVSASFDPNDAHWRLFNANAITEIRRRALPKDFICVIGGYPHKAIADAFPEFMTVEFGIGYGGTFSKYRVWESYAWMHTCYGAATHGNPQNANGEWFEAVIPGYLDPAMFPLGSAATRKKKDYYLFVGRLIDRKGYKIAIEVCQRLGKRLVIAGPGAKEAGLVWSPEVEYVGVVGPEERGKLMSEATAVFVPTIYIEPFGNVAIEAMACGTPVITSDWGAFTETVIDGVTGFRCRTFKEFCDAAIKARSLTPLKIQNHVIDRYSHAVIGAKYEAYFERLLLLWGKGWYEM
jgi:glycosyltransferase involved in cell wall biosynthesis